MNADIFPGSPWWVAWNNDLITIAAAVPILLLAFLYARGLRSLGQHPRFHSTWRPAAYYLGLFIGYMAVESPLDHFADNLFSAHMVQHELLMMVAAPLVLLGAPMIPVLRGIPRPIRRKYVRPMLQARPARAALRTLSNPFAAWTIFAIALVTWHLPGPYDLGESNDVIHDFEHLSLTLAAMLFWWNVIDPVPLKPNLSHLLRIPYAFTFGVLAMGFFAFVTLSEHPWYSATLQTAPLYGLTSLEDQQIGGVFMWIAGSFIMLAAVLKDLWGVVRDEQRAQEAEERLEHRSGPRRAAAP